METSPTSAVQVIPIVLASVFMELRTRHAPGAAGQQHQASTPYDRGFSGSAASVIGGFSSLQRDAMELPYDCEQFSML